MTIDNEPIDFVPDYYLRRDRTRGRSYPVAVSPYPGECLEDLLARAACENGFPPVMSYSLLGSLERTSATCAPGLNRYGITAKALATLLGNPGGPEELAPLLHNSPPTQKHLRPFFDIWLQGVALSRYRRVSPLALRNAPFLRATWRVWPITFDPETKEALLGNCPVCGQQLSFDFMGDVWCCDKCVEMGTDGHLCAVDLRDYPQPLVEERLWNDLDFATSFIDPTARDRRRATRLELHPDFSVLTDGAVFEAIITFARSMPKPAKSARLEISALNLGAAAQLVRRWPGSFEEFVANGNAGGPYPERSLRCLLYNSRLSGGLRERMKEVARASTVRFALSLAQFEEFTQMPGPTHEYRNLGKWIKRTHPRKAALLRSEANWMLCLYGRRYRQCENRGFNDREAAAS